MASDGLFIMAVNGIYGYHATKTGTKCSLVWMASCFVIPPSMKCRYLGTWDDIPEHDAESENIMPRMLTHADLHDDSNETESYHLSPELNCHETDEHRNEITHQERHFLHEDPVDDYLAEYANMISQKENEEQELYYEVKTRPSEREHNIHSVNVQVRTSERSQSPEERRRIFARRKSCPDAGRTGMSLSLNVAQEQTVDDLRVSTSTNSHSNPEKFSLKNITAMARRMSIPILDKSEDVDHGTKVYGETLVKKSKSIKQFREAFSEEVDDYIPHRAPKTLTKSLTTTEIENACDDLKSETPGSYKNVVTELKLRTQDYSENRYGDDSNNHDREITGPILSKSLTTSEIERASEDYKIQSPVQYRNVVQELQHRSEDIPDKRFQNDESHDHNSLDHSFTSSYNSEHSNSLRRHKPKKADNADTHNYWSKRPSDAYKNNRVSRTLPTDDFDHDRVSGSSTPRSNHDEHNERHKPTKQKSEEPVSDLMRKLTSLTAQTRVATRPSLGNVEGYEPSSSMMRSQSVINVSSASPLALSPQHDRNQFSSSFSSSASSSSDIPVLSYHNVVDPCHRCWKTVYSLDKIGPIRKVLFHKQCFRCVICNTMLTLNTYRQNVNDKSDVQVYCKKHVPSQESPHIGLDAKNLNVMLNHPKLDSVNTNIRGTLEDRKKSQNSLPFNIGRAVSTPRLDLICGPNENSESNGAHKLDKNGNVTLRELKMDDTPRSVWSRSTFSAAKLDLTVPASGRKGSTLYRTADTWNYL